MKRRASEEARILAACSSSDVVSDRPEPDPYDLRQQREERIQLAHEVVEAAWR